jgi:hypothetical protein
LVFVLVLNQLLHLEPTHLERQQRGKPAPRLALIRRITTFLKSAKAHKHIFLKHFFTSRRMILVGYGGIWWDMVGYGRIWWDLVGSGGGII